MVIYIKAFIAGLAFPASLLPIVYAILYVSGHRAVINVPLQFFPLFLPLVFGVWNILYFAMGKCCPVKGRYLRLWVTGAILGFLVALLGVFVIGLPTLLFGFTGALRYLPLVIVPILYGVIWRYIVGNLNELVDLKDWG